ncbi:MAG: prepilin-type N-terminal cleavage/methylation domain-containing protein [Gammaproteobacteria bacterium]|nr:prepilin-type N-terminal cleavage/methylation domain-containing protein [Gammaproteobacteria bacterium]
MRMTPNRLRGFSLVELAMVLFIISLLLGGLLVPLASQLEARQRNAALEQLDLIKEALIGFAIINGRLPCYTSETDPTNAYYGIEDTEDPGKTCNPTGLTSDGILPWKTLGMASGLDPWGIERTAAADPWIGYWRYRVDTTFESTSPLFALTDQSGEMSICDSNDVLLISTSERPVAVIYSTGADQTADGQNASYEAILTPSSICITPTGPTYQGGEVSGTFDDITVWLTRPLLFNRLVTAGTLP